MLYEQCPKQLGVVECGYYVMRFMREIVLQNNTSILDIVRIQLQPNSSKILIPQNLF